MNCPLCVDEVLDVTHHGGIEIDICPRCRGVWLDRGELERLLADDPPTVAARPGPAPTPPTDQVWYDQAPTTGKGPKPKKSKKKRLADRLGDVFEEVLDL
jgi:Zn-finger nucleic acid-binding protein